jgi:hypothetical protein
VSQVSLPVRILLIGAVVFLAAWFTVLRPKPATVSPVTAVTTPAATPQTGHGRAVAKARAVAGKAVATATPATTTGPATTTTPEAKPATPAVSISAAVLAKLPTHVAAALKARKVLVFGVIGDQGKPWAPIGDDDRYVRNTLHKLNRYDGDVFVKEIGAAQLVDYGSLVNGLKLNQTPSVVVIDRDLKGRVLTGYVDRVALNQVIQDARRDSIKPYITDAYLRQLNQVCTNSNVAFDRWSLPTIRGDKARRASFKRLQATLASYRSTVVRISAPAKWRALKQAWVAELNQEVRLGNRLGKSLTANDLGGYVTTLAAYDATAARKLDHRFDAAGLTSCSWMRPS